MKRTFQVIALAAATLFISCEGKQGEVGPAGAQGPQGTAGVQGTKGDPGNPAGAIQFKLNKGLNSNADGSFGLSVDLTAATSSLIENGVVMLYMQYQNVWIQFPTSMLLNGEVYTYQMAYTVENNKLNIGCTQFKTTGVSTSKVAVAFQNARIVVVPAVNGRLNAEFDWSNYEAVKKAYKLED